MFPNGGAAHQILEKFCGDAVAGEAASRSTVAPTIEALDRLIAAAARCAERNQGQSLTPLLSTLLDAPPLLGDGSTMRTLLTTIEHMFVDLIEELATLSTPEVDAVIAEAELTRRASETRLAAAVAVVSARGSFRDDGYRSLRSYLKGTLNCSGAQANRIIRRADLINGHEAVGDAFLAGLLGVDQIDRLATACAHPRAGDQFVDFVPTLLAQAEQLEFNDFDKVIDHFIDHADPDGAFDTQQFHEDQRTASVRDDNGAVTVHASGGDPQAAAEMTQIFELAVQAEFDADCAARRTEHEDDALNYPLPRSADQRKFDALHQIFLSWATVPTDGTTPDPLVNILFDHISAGTAMFEHGLADSPNIFGLPEDTFAAAARDLSKRRCETTTGTSVHPDVALRALVAGRVRRAVVDADSVVIDLGRTQRLFIGKAREAAQLLVTTCTHRGCDIPATLCDVDHRQEWAAHAGPTDQANAMPLCGTHDRWKHANTIRSRRALSGRLFLIRPNGTTVLPVGAREPNWAEPPPTETHAESSPPAPSIHVHDPWAAFPAAVEFGDVTMTVRSGGPPHHWYFDGVQLIKKDLATEMLQRDDRAVHQNKPTSRTTP